MTDEQITQFKDMAKGGLGGRGGGPPGNIQDEGDNFAAGQDPMAGNQQSVTPGFDINTWVFVGDGTVLVLAGLSFVVLFKRRRN